MTSVVTGDDRRSPRMKPKSGNQKISIDATATTVVKDETRSFLDFSRENLSISQSELEQGFNKPPKCFRPSRHSVLSLVVIFVVLACAAVEIWEFHRVISNSRDIEIIKQDVEVIKRDVEALRHRMFGEDFVDDLKAFEEQVNNCFFHNYRFHPQNWKPTIPCRDFNYCFCSSHVDSLEKLIFHKFSLFWFQNAIFLIVLSFNSFFCNKTFIETLIFLKKWINLKHHEFRILNDRLFDQHHVKRCDSAKNIAIKKNCNI